MGMKVIALRSQFAMASDAGSIPAISTILGETNGK